MIRMPDLRPDVFDGWREGALSAPEPDAVLDALAGRATTRSAAMLEWVEERAAAVCPSVPVEQSAPYLLALIEHAIHGTDDTRAALLALVVPDRVDAEEALATLGEVIQRAHDGWLAPDPMPPAPERRAKTLRGPAPTARVVDSLGNVATSDELLKQADALLLASIGHEVEGVLVFPGLPARTGDAPDYTITPSLALLGTDAWSWSEMVDTPSESHARDWLTVNGLPIGAAMSAHHMGDSVTSEARKRRGYRARRATYARGLSVDKRGKVRGGSEYVTPCTPMIGYGWAHVVELATTLEGWRWVGHRLVRKPRETEPTTRAARAARKARVAMARRTVATVETLRADVAAFLAPVLTGADTGAGRWELPDGTRVTVTPEPDQRRFIVGVSIVGPDGKRVASRTSARTVANVTAAIGNRIR